MIFSAEEDYRRVSGRRSPARRAGRFDGLAAQGIVATYRGGRSDDELLGTLVHELGSPAQSAGPRTVPAFLAGRGDLRRPGSEPDHPRRPSSAGNLVAQPRPAPPGRSASPAARRRCATSPTVYGPDGSAPGRLDLGRDPRPGVGGVRRPGGSRAPLRRSGGLHSHAARLAGEECGAFAAGSPRFPRAARRPRRRFAGRSTGPGRSSTTTLRSGRAASSPACRRSAPEPRRSERATPASPPRVDRRVNG